MNHNQLPETKTILKGKILDYFDTSDEIKKVCEKFKKNKSHLVRRKNLLPSQTLKKSK